jgi:Rio2, N-terminal
VSVWPQNGELSSTLSLGSAWLGGEAKATMVQTPCHRRHGGTYRHLRTLLRFKLVHHDAKQYDGYRLTYMGYDFLAIRTLLARGHISAVGRRIGVGKESDVFEVGTHASLANEFGTSMAAKALRWQHLINKQMPNCCDSEFAGI